jgi:hypothetical protein
MLIRKFITNFLIGLNSVTGVVNLRYHMKPKAASWNIDTEKEVCDKAPRHERQKSKEKPLIKFHLY